MDYDFKTIESKWQHAWAKDKLFEAKMDPSKKKYYVLEMFPYPSGKLHMGHSRNYSIGDCCARYKRMQGYNVLYPMGYDALGLPAENAAIKNKVNPRAWTLSKIAEMKTQQQQLGYSYDWNRQIATCEPEYYHWNQWIFLQMLKKNLAYKAKAKSNYCPSCQTVLANEQVIDGACWRCHNEVVQKEFEQWFFRITAYAEELNKDLALLKEWPTRVPLMQTNWIGKSEGVTIDFPLVDSKEKLSAYTTRCDTIFSVTFLAMAPEHPLLEQLVKGTPQEKEIKEFKIKVAKQTAIDRENEGKEKEGVFTGIYAINPTTNEKIPVYAANFALMYGTGIVMCDAHDKRDFRFANKYNIPLKFVISSDGKKINPTDFEDAFTDDGILFDSGSFSGQNNRDALPKMANWLEQQGFGKKTTHFKLRDWLVSRQRYWGTPIPIIYCNDCGMQPVPEKDLPVKLPENAPITGEGNPLDKVESFVNVKCPKCGKNGRRETDTMDTFVDSSWYYYRYCSPHDSKMPFDSKEAAYWMPVDQYIGGIEHAILHLLYARFFSKVLRDIGLTTVEEPFTRLLSQGMVLNQGKVMSKSAGNGIDPGDLIEQFGADSTRTYILSASHPEKELEWNDAGIVGTSRFLNRVFQLAQTQLPLEKKQSIEIKSLNHHDQLMLSRIHSTIARVSERMETFDLNMAVSDISTLTEMIEKYQNENPNAFIWNEGISTILLLLTPFAPHLTEELWSLRGNKGFIAQAPWPQANVAYISPEAEQGEQLVENVIRDIQAIMELAKVQQPKQIILYTAPEWKWNGLQLAIQACQERPDFGAVMKTLMNDPAIRQKGKAVESFAKQATKLAKDLANNVRVKEEALLNEEKKRLETIFKCSILIMDGDKATIDPAKKAQNAFPFKPAIYLEG